MSEHHSDGVGEAVDDILRQALMVAARLAEVAARARQEHLTQARARSERDGQEAAARLQAEHAAARASLAPVQEKKWWARVNPEQIGAAYQTAATWAGQDPDIAKTLQYMNDKLAERGIHVTSSMPKNVSELIRAREWVAREDPFMDGAFTREMAKTTTPQERDRLNSSLVSAWLATPEGQQQRALSEQRKSGKSETEIASEWVREHAPEYYQSWLDDGRDIDTAMGRESHRKSIVTYWEKHRNDKGGNGPANELAMATAWAKEAQPEWFKERDLRNAFPDTADAGKSDENELIRRWKADTQTAEPSEVAALNNEATQLEGAAILENSEAKGHRAQGDKAAARAQEHQDQMPPPDMDGPSAADLAWLNAQDSDRDNAEAHQEWDTAERRSEFADSLRGKADQAAVEARVLADVSQGTHPSAAVRSGPRNAPKAQKTKPRQSHQLTKGSR